MMKRKRLTRQQLLAKRKRALLIGRLTPEMYGRLWKLDLQLKEMRDDLRKMRKELRSVMKKK